MRHGGNTGGHNAGVSGRPGPALASPNSLKNQRPSLVSDGRLVLGSWHSTPELRPRGLQQQTKNGDIRSPLWQDGQDSWKTQRPASVDAGRVRLSPLLVALN